VTPAGGVETGCANPPRIRRCCDRQPLVRALQPFAPWLHLFPWKTRRRTGVRSRRRTMEIAAIVMLAAVLMGFLQQFDRQRW
jgi:hypothetical protein